MFRGNRDSLRAVLSRDYRHAERRTPSASALADALVALEGEAVDIRAEIVALRLVKHSDTIVLDLGDASGAVVVIAEDGWRIVDISPVTFRRTALTGALPVPERGGDLIELRQFLNVTEESWVMVLGWLVAALLPDIPHPALMLGGEQGTGKSTAARMLAGLVDSSPVPLR